MERLTELLQALGVIESLSDTDLRNAVRDLTDACLTARAGTLSREANAILTQGAAKVAEIKAELAAREVEAAEIIAEADAALASLALDDETDGNGDGGEGEAAADDATAGGEGDGNDDDADGGEGDGSLATDEGGDGDPVVASAGTPPKPSGRKVTVPGKFKPRTDQRSGRPVLLASGEMKGVSPGHEFASIEEMDAALFEKWASMRGTADGIQHHMATIDYRGLFDDAHQLMGGDPYEVTDKIMRACRNRQESMVASGGVPGPSEPRYEQITLGQANRPLRDALPSFLASRGTIIFNQSPLLAEVLLDTAAGAIGEVTSAQDLATATKNVQEISAPTPVTATVVAETLRWQQGNFADRFYPERTRAFMALGQVAYARHNEALRLADIKTASTKYTDVGVAATYGAYIDLKREFLAVVEEIEDRVRDFNQPLVVLMPEYVPALLAMDVFSRHSGGDTWNMTPDGMKADMRSWAPNVRMVFLSDSVRGRMLSTPTGQSPRTPTLDLDVEWFIFPEGAWLFLDGGQLDLGIIRDSTLSATNKFQTFFESWEAVAQVINLSWFVTSTLCASGVTQIALDRHICQPYGS
jgi:hypothetical protein